MTFWKRSSLPLLANLFCFLLFTYQQSHGWSTTYGGTASDGSQCEIPFTMGTLRQAVMETGSSGTEMWWNDKFGQYGNTQDDRQFYSCTGYGECIMCVVHNNEDESIPLWGFCNISWVPQSTKFQCITGNFRTVLYVQYTV